MHSTNPETTKMKPTLQQYPALQEAYDYFNLKLFHGMLPECLLTLPRSRRYKGYFAPDRWKNLSGESTHELALNPGCITPDSIPDVMGTLIHELTHVWQRHNGTPGRNGYHNLEWAVKMEEVGLMPSDTGKPGGKRTGDRMTHYIIAGGKSDQAISEFLTSRTALAWFDRSQTNVDTTSAPSKLGNRSNRARYECPGCNILAWGKPGLLLVCGNCEEELTPNNK